MADFTMPSLGADMTEGVLVAWRVAPGDNVQRGDIMAEVETQKGLFEVEVFTGGVVEELLVEPGPEKIPVGTVLARITETDTEPAVAENGPEPERVQASPAARRLAAEHQIDLHGLNGTGAQGAISLADVERAIAAAQEADETHSSAPAAGPDREAMRSAIAAAMSRSNREIPHYYLALDIDMSKALTWLEERNRTCSIRDRLLPVVLPLKAVALALRKIPELNAHWIEGRLELRPEIALGFAVALRSGGLLTPALKTVDQRSLEELMSALSDLITRTRAGKLRASEISGAGITVTSLGDLGVETVFGVIYPPQVALVGLGRIRERPWAENGKLSARPVLTATLAADHRAGDGHQGAQFLDEINRLLQEPEAL